MIRLLSGLLALLPTPALLRLGAVLGWVWYRLIPLRRADARRAAARAFPEKSVREREEIVRKNFVHLVQSLLEAIAFIAYPKERLQSLVRFEGLVEAVEAARAAGKGTIAISIHIGSFELCMGSFGIFQPHVPIVIIARVPKAGFARRMLEAVRAKTKMEVLPPKGSLPRVVKRLNDDRAILGFVIDQNMPRKRGVFVPFLGQVASTTIGFSLIARRSGAVVVPGWNERQPDGTHVGHWGPPLALSDHPHPRIAALNDALAMSKLAETWVHRRPEQWFWVHRRWKTQPQPGDVVRTDRGLEIHGKGRAGVLLDRDGVINREIGRGVVAPEELSLVPGAAEAIRRLNGAGVPVLVVTNQANVARGVIDEAQLGRIHEHLAGLLAKEGATLDRIYYCPHHPTEGKGAYAVACDCRKPLPGLVKKAMLEWDLNPGASLYVGDRETDVKAAQAADLRVAVVSNGWAHTTWVPPENAKPDETHENLIAAVDTFLDRIVGNE